MRRYLDTPKREMSIVRKANTKIVNHPIYKSTNTDILEVKQVELTDTATVVHFYAYYIPNYWLQVSTDAKLTDAKSVSYALKKAEGITPGEHFFCPKAEKPSSHSHSNHYLPIQNCLTSRKELPKKTGK